MCDVDMRHAKTEELGSFAQILWGKYVTPDDMCVTPRPLYRGFYCHRSFEWIDRVQSRH